MREILLNEQKQISKKYELTKNYNSEIDNLEKIKIPYINEIVPTIYLFVNIVNGKVYVGQTYTKYYERFGRHYCDAFNKKDDIYFHRALRKYGWQCFNKYIIWQGDCYEKTNENVEKVKDLLNEKEIKFIEKFDSYNSGYNSTKGGFYIPEATQTQESIEKRKTAMQGKHHMIGKIYEKHHLAKKVKQFDFDGNFIKEWPCIKLAEDTLHISINPKLYYSGSYIWINSDEFSEEYLQKKINKVKKIYYNPENICCFGIDGELIEVYSSYAEIEKVTGLNKSNIATAAKAKENGSLVQGYIWILESDLKNKELIINSILSKSRYYKHNCKPVYQIYLNGEIIKIWDNVAEIYKEFPNSKASINKCLTNKLNFYNNCLWIYEDEISDELIESKIESSKIRHRKLIEGIQNGLIKYDPEYYLNSKHNTSKSNKQNEI